LGSAPRDKYWIQRERGGRDGKKKKENGKKRDQVPYATLFPTASPSSDKPKITLKN